MVAPVLPPSPPPFYGYSRLEQSGLVTAGPSYLSAVFITPDGAACDVAVYNGEDDSPFGLFHTFTTGAAITLRMLSEKPLYFNRGIYVTLDEHAQEVTVLWSPVASELGEPQSPFPELD
ncbi:hypothetical protein ES708_14221 [subsurface metagenome]